MSEEYQNAVLAADARRRLAHRDAHKRKAAARRNQLTEWRARKLLAEAAFEEIKSNPDHPEHDARRRALDALQVQPSERPLLAQLDADVRAADQAYHADVAALRKQYGIVAVPAPR